MADPVDSARSDDELIVAYLDGELDAESRALLDARLAGEAPLRARLEALRRGERRFGEAFDAVLSAAPNERMRAMLADLVGRRSAAPSRMRWAAAGAAAILIFAVGAAAGYLAPRLIGVAETEVAEEQSERPNWRQAVAGYQRYISADTMEVIAESPGVLGAELEAVGAKLALDLSADNLALEHAYLKRVQLFDYRDRPLVQVAYLSRDDGPISFCIIANDREDEAIEFEEREGFNVVYWNKAGRGYLLIGTAPRETLETFAGLLAERVG